MNTRNLVLAATLFSLNASANTPNVLDKLVSIAQSGTQLVLTIDSTQYCNSPIVELEYNYSNRATFGPHFYNLKVIGINRMLCMGSKNITVTIDVPEHRRAGDLLVITDGENNLTSIQLN